MATAYIIDDEPRSADILKAKIIDLTDMFDKIECFTNPLVGYRSIWEEAPDILFLDIQMPQLNGIDLLDNIKHTGIPTVYVTAYSQYSITAIKQRVFDYILKPVKERELLETIIKLKSSLKSTKATAQWRPQISELMGMQNNKLPIATSDGINLITINQIVNITGHDNYSNFHLIDGLKILTSKTLKNYEQILSPFGFFRPHKSHLVNTTFIDKVVVRDGGMLLMRNGEFIPISKDKKKDIMDWYKS
nr:LytTR family DNA-binding domain-containing protein [uncultured Dyadobacter sp.]